MFMDNVYNIQNNNVFVSYNVYRWHLLIAEKCDGHVYGTVLTLFNSCNLNPEKDSTKLCYFG